MNKEKIMKITLVLIVICLLLVGCQEAQKVWGEGDLPADWESYFGSSNISRLLHHRIVEEEETKLIREQIDLYCAREFEKLRKANKQNEIKIQTLIDKNTVLKERIKKLEKLKKDK